MQGCIIFSLKRMSASLRFAINKMIIIPEEPNDEVFKNDISLFLRLIHFGW
jgi:hypothetical protein